MTSRSRTFPRTILVTGCSSGIGRASAERLAARGHTVWATARSEADVEQLRRWADSAGSGSHAARLDVTDPDTIRAVAGEMLDRCGRIDAVINNAGYGQIGAVEDVPCELWRRQIETNLIGVIAVTQAVLPAMRQTGFGRIVNVSSVVAHVTVPLMGAYCASKHALDAMSGALRIEVAPFGIDVVLIEPGPIATNFRPNVDAVLADNPVHEKSAYESAYRAMDAYWAQQFSGKGPTASDVATLVTKAVEARRPRTRYRITTVAKWMPRILPFISDRMFDKFAARRMEAMARKGK